jgi:hypothetical protein
MTCELTDDELWQAILAWASGAGIEQGWIEG